MNISLEEKIGETCQDKEKEHQFKTKEGRQYTNEIRALYYQLLSKQLSPAKIEQVIRIVLETFCPQLDTYKLELPKSSLATKMRSCEMPTVTLAHEAAVLAQSTSQVLGSDGTTLNQKKVQGSRLGDLTVGVEPVADGSAKSLIAQLDTAFTAIRKIGQELEIPGHENIGWHLVTTVMSDQASSQKAFNRMVEEKQREEKEARGDIATGADNCKELLVTFCGMHVGVNLRAAEVKGLNKHIKEYGNKTAGVDTIVHSCCKLLGHLGTNPEYGRGVVGFPEFLLAEEEETSDLQKKEEFRQALKIKLERQVGSRYFVTSRNAGRLYFLASFAVSYIHKVEEIKELNTLHLTWI